MRTLRRTGIQNRQRDNYPAWVVEQILEKAKRKREDRQRRNLEMVHKGSIGMVLTIRAKKVRKPRKKKVES